jgi:hypothetical protein
MLYKMLYIELARKLRREHDDGPKPRQLFVTQSRHLTRKVEEQFVELTESFSTASKSPQELIEIAKAQKLIQKSPLVDMDDDVNWRSDLPAQFSLLGDEDFPLFITFDRVSHISYIDVDHA